jgi:hypothetical protein
MTRKQFEWLRENQPIEVCWFRPYECKTPADYHCIHDSGKGIGMEIRGEYIIFSGNYHTYDNGTWHQHYARYKFHYKNIREIRYRRKRQE